MAEKRIVFADNSYQNVSGDSQEWNQIVDVEGWEGVKPIIDKFTRENLASWHYSINGEKEGGDYTDYRLAYFEVFPKDEGYTLHIHTQKIPEVELMREQLAALEEGQEMQNEAIDFLLMGGE